jgi:putative salt-induced outer membrane protein YdiY
MGHKHLIPRRAYLGPLQKALIIQKKEPLMKRILILLIIIIIHPIHAWAEDLPQLKSNVGVSVVDNQGNVNSRSVKLDGEMVYNQEVSTQKIKSGMYYAETDEKKTAGSQYVNFKNKNLLGETFYVHQFAGLEADEFIGYDYRLDFNGGLGARWEAESHKGNIEAGPGFVYEEYEAGSKGYPTAKGLLAYTYTFNERISGNTELTHLRDLNDGDNYRVNWVTSAKVKISDILSLRFGRKFQYINMPPKGACMHDWVSEVTLVMDF